MVTRCSESKARCLCYPISDGIYNDVLDHVTSNVTIPFSIFLSGISNLNSAFIIAEKRSFWDLEEDTVR